MEDWDRRKKELERRIEKKKKREELREKNWGRGKEKGEWGKWEWRI
jgi:hypothetical protein